MRRHPLCGQHVITCHVLDAEKLILCPHLRHRQYLDAALLAVWRIHEHVAEIARPLATGALLVNLEGRKMAQIVMRNYIDEARRLAKDDNPKQASAIENFRFYDLGAMAADDTEDQRGHQAAADLLGHGDTRTTSKHYLRRGKTTLPTKWFCGKNHELRKFTIIAKDD